MISILAPLLCTVLLAQTPAPQAFTYRFDEVKRSVVRWPAGDKAREVKVAKGDQATTGDGVKTGWWGQAVLSVPERKARFEVYANTQVKLAGGEPGVLLVLSQGRIKAFFQHLVDGTQMERQVAVPGALLAVRGTRYGVEVGQDGKSTLVVFEGVVEVLHQTPHAEPIFVKAGEWTTISLDRVSKAEPMTLRGFGERAWSQGMRPDGSMSSSAMAPGSSMSKGMGPGSTHRH